MRCPPAGVTSQPKAEDLMLPGACGRNEEHPKHQPGGAAQAPREEAAALTVWLCIRNCPQKGELESTQPAHCNLMVRFSAQTRGGWLKGELSTRMGDNTCFFVSDSTATPIYATKCNSGRASESLCLQPACLLTSAFALGIVRQLVNTLKRKFLINSSYIKHAQSCFPSLCKQELIYFFYFFHVLSKYFCIGCCQALYAFWN